MLNSLDNHTNTGSYSGVNTNIFPHHEFLLLLGWVQLAGSSWIEGYEDLDIDELHCELASFLRNHEFEVSRPPYRLERAASYYLKVGGEDNYVNAMECFSKAGKWKKVLEVCNKLRRLFLSMF